MQQASIIPTQKIIFLGAVRAGKSTVVKILTGKYSFSAKDYEMTQGIELFDKAFVIDGHTVDTILVDTAGHQLYRWILKPVCDENAFYALCLDLTSKSSLHILEAYIEELGIRKGMVIGCKSDLTSRHVVSLSAAEEFAVNNNLKLHVTSTRTTAAEMDALFLDSIMEYFTNAA